MKDEGIQHGLITKFETSNPAFKTIYGFRKMFWKYLKKLGVAFYDPCCEDASPEEARPVRYNETAGRLEYFNGAAWVATTGGATTTAAPATTTTTTTGA